MRSDIERYKRQVRVARLPGLDGLHLVERALDRYTPAAVTGSTGTATAGTESTGTGSTGTGSTGTGSTAAVRRAPIRPAA